MAVDNECRFRVRIYKDPELNYTPNGTAVAKAFGWVQVGSKDREGNWMSFGLNLIFWKDLAEAATGVEEYSPEYSFEDKDEIIVHGRLNNRKWVNSEGQNRYSLELTVNEFYVDSRYSDRMKKKKRVREDIEEIMDELDDLGDSADDSDSPAAAVPNNSVDSTYKKQVAVPGAKKADGNGSKGNVQPTSTKRGDSTGKKPVVAKSGYTRKRPI